MSAAVARAAGATPRASGEWRGIAAMLGATLIWGATFVIIRDSVRALDPRTLVFLRFAAATVVLGAIALARRAALDRPTLLGGVLGGACAAGGFLFQAIGLTRTSAGTSAFLTCTGTVLAAVFAWPLLGQRPSRTLLLGIALAVAGSALLPGNGGLRLGPGESWTLLGAVVYAVQIVVLARWAGAADPVALTFLQCATLTLIVAPLAPHPLETLRRLDGAMLGRLGYLAFVAGALAPFLQVIAQRTLPAGRVGLLFALEPVFALLFAITLGGERFGGAWWVGAALIVAGVLAVEANALRGERRP